MTLLTREVPMANRSLAGKLILGSFVVGVLASPFVVRPRVTPCRWPESKIETAEEAAWRFAHEAFPQWQRTYGQECPHSAYELTEFLEGVKAQDPWGSRYEVRCDHGRVIVVSNGEDGVPNTRDDLRSDR